MTTEETKQLASSIFDFIPKLRDKFFLPLNVVRIYELSSRQSEVLLALAHVGPLTMSELAKIANISNQLLTSVVNYLESIGYVKREPLPENKRTIKIDITEKGINVLKAYRDRVIKEIAKVVDIVSDDDAEKLIEILQVFYEILDKYPAKRKD